MARATEKSPTFWLKSRFGNVRVYIRNHINGCPFTSPDQQSCRCPKWIYAKPLDGTPKQYSAGTPSFTEAVEKATEELERFNPTIAAAAALVQPDVPTGITIKAALAEFYDGKARNITEDSLNSVRGVFDRSRTHIRGRQTRLASPLLDFLDENFPDITYLRQLKGVHLDKWATTWKVADTTARGRRGIVNDFLHWAEFRDLI